MPLSTHLTFVNRAIDILKDDPRIMGIAAGGSWITNVMDEFSDIDLVIVVDPECELEVSDERLNVAGKLGNLLAGFTGEHVGEPRLIICLYGSPILHVDLKFVKLDDFGHRVEDPTILWEREKVLSVIIDKEVAVYPLPQLQWIEDRFWVWVHYVATKLGRGEVFEAIETLSFLRTTVLGPLALMKNGCFPRGMRFIERDAKEELPLFIKTIPTHDVTDCAVALKHVITLYQQLRTYHSTPELLRRKEAEEQSIIYLNYIINKL
ncbi:MAG: polymerase, beta domain protein region [Firmicutes bacterium]|nr:polymerase, beta domain protein region [Bacillota bacterium]